MQDVNDRCLNWTCPLYSLIINSSTKAKKTFVKLRCAFGVFYVPTVSRIGLLEKGTLTLTE